MSRSGADGFGADGFKEPTALSSLCPRQESNLRFCLLRSLLATRRAGNRGFKILRIIDPFDVDSSDGSAPNPEPCSTSRSRRPPASPDHHHVLRDSVDCPFETQAPHSLTSACVAAWGA